MPSFRSLTSLDAKPVLIIFACVFFIASSGFWSTSRLSVSFTHSVNVYTGAQLNPMVHTSPGENVEHGKTGKQDQEWQEASQNGTTRPGPMGRKALVIASFMAQNVSWVDYMPHDWEIYRYVLDDPSPTNSTNFTVPRNQGREAMAYLTFIIDNYRNLPAYMTFVHGHFRSWHQQETITSKLRALNLTDLYYSKFVNLRCNLSPGCGAPSGTVTWHPGRGGNHRTMDHLHSFWRTIFPPPTYPQDDMVKIDYGDPRQTGEVPVTLQSKCCAQFAVSREAVLEMPLEAWERVRAPLLMDLHEFEWGKHMDGAEAGLLYEPIWHFFFGMGAEYCPDPDYCRKVQFQNKIACDNYISFGGSLDDVHCQSIFDDELGITSIHESTWWINGTKTRNGTLTATRSGTRPSGTPTTSISGEE